MELIHITPNPELLLEKCIRVCYNSFDKCDGSIECARALIKKIINNWHLDTLEHATATFKVVCSRACMAQFTRHRIASFGVESQRYVNYQEESHFIAPPISDGQLYYEEFMKIALETYRTLIDSYGWKKEDARLALPEGWSTNLYVTMNFRQWRHFFELRSDKAAQWEIRSLSDTILKVLHGKAPSVFEDIHKRYVSAEE